MLDFLLKISASSPYKRSQKRIYFFLQKSDEYYALNYTMKKYPIISVKNKRVKAS